MIPLQELRFQTVEPEGGREPELTVIAIHGRGSYEGDLLGLAGYFDQPIRWVAPRGPLELHFGGGVGYAWYRFAQAGDPDPQDFASSLESLTDFVRRVRSTHNVPSERLMLLGFSQGAVMSIGLALTIPGEIGGVVALSGYFPRPKGWQAPDASLEGLPILVTHGDRDAILPVEWGREAAETLNGMGADAEYREYPGMGHEVSPQVIRAVDAWLKERASQGPG